MKFKNIFYTLTLTAAATIMAGCEGEKDLVVIEGNLPIKTSSLFMVGEATQLPTGGISTQPHRLRLPTKTLSYSHGRGI